VQEKHVETQKESKKDQMGGELERMIVLTKDLNTASAKRLEKKILKLLEASQPMVNISEELEILVESIKPNEMQALKSFAKENGYELEVVE
jgi:hypothetical protein